MFAYLEWKKHVGWSPESRRTSDLGIYKVDVKSVAG